MTTLWHIRLSYPAPRPEERVTIHAETYQEAGAEGLRLKELHGAMDWSALAQREKERRG